MHPNNIHLTVIKRLFFGWLLLSAVIGGVVFYLKTENIDVLVRNLALRESATLTSSYLDYSRQPTLEHLEALQRRSEEHTRSHFVVIELYDSDKKLLVEALRSGSDRISQEAHTRVHIFPLGKKPHYQKFYIEGQMLLQVMTPLWDQSQNLVGYFEGVYQVDEATLKDIKQDVIGTLALVVVVILATSVMLYPIIISLNRGLMKLSSDLLRGNLELMDVLGSAIAKRDSDTNTHNYRVTIYAIRLAEALGLGAEQIRNLIAGAFLHDVGKIGVRDNILLKPDKLTDEEFQTMRSHVMQGVDIIAKSHWLQGARKVVEFHHEKFDGSGYPKGLKGGDIPLVARIFTIADVFDALTSRRPYKEPFPFEEALLFMQEKRGSQFDPELLNIFFTIIPALYREVGAATDAEVEAMLNKLVQKHFFKG